MGSVAEEQVCQNRFSTALIAVDMGNIETPNRRTVEVSLPFFHRYRSVLQSL